MLPLTSGLFILNFLKFTLIKQTQLMNFPPQQTVPKPSWRFPRWLSGKEFIWQGRRHWFHPWVGKIPWSRERNWLQYPCLENSMDRGAWRATVHGVTKSMARLKTFLFILKLTGPHALPLVQTPELRISFTFFVVAVFLLLKWPFIIQEVLTCKTVSTPTQPWIIHL